MTVTEIQLDVAEEMQQETVVEILQNAEVQRQKQYEAEQKLRQDQWEYNRLTRRSAQLAHSFTAAHQRERTSLQVPLMKLHRILNPTSIYRPDDDFDIVMRAERRE